MVNCWYLKEDGTCSNSCLLRCPPTGQACENGQLAQFVSSIGRYQNFTMGMKRGLIKILKMYIIVMICYFVVVRLTSFFFGEQKNGGPNHPDPHNVLKEVPEVMPDPIPTERQTRHKEVNIMVEIAKPLPKKSRKKEQKKMDTPPKKELTKKRSWKKKIAFRRKNFGSLEEWDPNPEMKKVLLWTGYGPQQEGMLLWKRVFKSIGLSISSLFSS